MRQQVNTQKQLRDGVVKYVDRIVKGKVVGRELNSVWVEHNNKIQAADMKIARLNGNVMQMARIKFPWINSLMSLGNGLNQITMIAQSVGVAIQGINAAISPIINRARQIDGMKLSFEGFGMTVEQANGILDRSKEIALRYGASLTGIEKGFKRITPAILASGGSLEETAMVMESLSARTATLGLNTEQTGRYIEAFAQVMGKGKLQSEELNQQFSELDGSLRSQIAAYLKAEHGIDDLEAAMKKGEVTSGIFREAFVAISKEMRDNLSGQIEEVQQRLDDLNIQQVQNIVSTLNTITLEGLGQTFAGLGKSLQRVQVAFSQFFASLQSELPVLTNLFKISLAAIGGAVEIVVTSFLTGFRFLLQGVEGVLAAVVNLGRAIATIPGVDRLIKGIADFGATAMENLRFTADAVLGLGNSINASGTKLDKVNGKIMVLQNRLQSGKLGDREAREARIEISNLRVEAAGLEQQMRNAALADEMELLKNQVEGSKDQMKLLKAEAQPLKDEYTAQKQAMNALKQAIQERYAYEIEQSKKVEENIKERIKREKERHESVKESIAARYDYEEERVNQIYDKKMQNIQGEIDALGGKTPAEQELYELRKTEIRQKLAAGDLDKKERLELEAQLERMERQERIQKKQNELAEEKKKKEEQQKIIQEQRNKKLDEENKKHEKNKKTLDQMLDEVTEKTKTLQAEQEKYLEEIEQSTEEIKIQVKSLDEIPELIEKQIRRTNDAKDAYFRVKRQIDEVTSSINIATQAQLRLNQTIQAGLQLQSQLEAVGDGNNRFAGGPVTGGAKYTVNELGQEGFLSASGKLSAINAPAWGQWRAPGAGTVIPAHIWGEMSASGATAAASSASGNASGVSASGGMMRGLMRLASGNGDRINNSVTIQAANTTQAASDMLVQLNRIRNKRYRG